MLQVRIEKFGEKTVTKRSVMMSILQHQCPGSTPEERANMLVEMMGVAKVKEHVPCELADAALKTMPAQEVSSSFQSLRERLDQELMTEKFSEYKSRHVDERAAKLYSTPEVIRKLRLEWRGSSIMFDVPRRSVEGYYPDGRPSRSTSISWNESRTKLSCLSFVVEFLWRNHADKGRVSCQSWKKFLRVCVGCELSK